MKKFLAGFMALILMLTSSVYTGFGYADTGTVEPDQASLLDSGEMKVKGTNSFGMMLADSLAAEMDEQDSNHGCNVFSIEVKGREASVSFETLQDATLVVGIYDEAGIAMLASGKAEVSAGDTQAVIPIDIDAMPQYFYLRGFLVDGDTLRPLCTAYESPNYTKEMQEFFAKTTDDFDADRVLNLDADKTNNFAVYSDKVTAVSGSGIVVVSIDEENNTYVFKNADSIAAMQQGDVFSYECADGNVLIVKVDGIRVDGDTVTVTGMDTSMEDVFEYVRIDTSSGLSDITVDDTKCDEGVTYNGIVHDSGTEAHLNAFDVDQELGGSLSFDIKKEDKNEVSGNTEKKGIYGNVNLKISGSVKAYISWSYQYMEVKLNYSVKANLKISITEEKKMALGFIGISPLPGLFLEFTPSFVVRVSASVSISATLGGTVGFRAEIGKGIENISTSPRLDVELKGEISVFIGLSLEPKIKIVSDHLARASLDVTLGAEAKGTLKHTVVTTAKASASKIHECKNCIGGDISAKAELKFSTKLLNSDKFSFGLSKSFTIKICDWYFSVDFGEFGVTQCPHYLYKTTITVEDFKKNLVRDAEVKAPFIIFEKDENGNEKKKQIESARTNDAAKVEGYLASGKYDVSVTAAGYSKTIEKVTVKDNAKSVRVLMWEKMNGSGGGNGGSSGENPKPPIENPGDNETITPKNGVQTFSLGGDHSGAVTADGSLYMWGSNWRGQIGGGTTEHVYRPKKVLDNVVSVSLGDDHSGAVTADGSLYMWGQNGSGQIGNGTTEHVYRPKKVLDNVVSVSLGDFHSGAVTADGSLYMWGYNGYGQIGDGMTEYVYRPKKVLDNVVSVSLGSCHSGAVTADGSLYMWGYNGNGQIGVGDGTTEDVYIPKKILENIKMNDRQITAKQTRSISSDSPFFILAKETEKTYALAAADSREYRTASFTGLMPNAVYNFYAVRSRSVEDLLHTSNLLYVSQAAAGEDGSLQVSYQSKENDANEQTFVVGAARYDLASAAVHVSDLEYTQKQQYIQPVVTYQGKTLTEWEDYELLGDYSATDVGDYTVTVHGIGNYKGSVAASYKILESKSRKIEKITLSIADASLNAGNTLQLLADIFPENAENKTLKWTSSDEKVAVVDNNGMVTAIDAGEAVITVESQDGSGVSASCVITVTKISDNSSGGGTTGGSGGSSSGSAPGGSPSGNPGGSPSDNHPSDGENGGMQVKLLYYIVDFNANGGTKLSRGTMTLLNDDNLGILPKVQRKNYMFSGWYTQKTGGTKVSSSTVLNAGTTLFARWKKAPKPSKVKISVLKSSKAGQLAVNFGKITGAKGYETAYSTNKKFPASSTKKTVSASAGAMLKKLKSGKKYYVRVRAYLLDSAGNKVYGSYSTVKSIHVK